MRQAGSGRGSRRGSDEENEDNYSETGSGHMTMEGRVADDGERGESPVAGEESEAESSVSNPLEDSHYFELCKVCTIWGDCLCIAGVGS